MERRACTVGLDVGGTKIAGIALDRSGEVVEHRTIATGVERGGADALDRAVALAEELVSAARQGGHEPLAIGIGVPELVSPEGAIVSDGVIPWLGLPVAERFGSLLPAILESDVRAAARAEAELGCGRGLHSFVYVNVGTGISSALVIGGRPYAGAHGGAIVLASGAQSCRCPSCGEESSVVLEEIASGPGIVARYRELGGHAERAEHVVEAAGRGDAAAMRVGAGNLESARVEDRAPRRHPRSRGDRRRRRPRHDARPVLGDTRAGDPIAHLVERSPPDSDPPGRPRRGRRRGRRGSGGSGSSAAGREARPRMTVYVEIIFFSTPTPLASARSTSSGTVAESWSAIPVESKTVT